jgi:ribosomal protein S11
MKFKKSRRRISKLFKKPHFFFGRKDKKGKIFLKRSRSNYFITMTDIKGRVIRSYTTGSVVFGSKRKCLSPYAIEGVFNKLVIFIKLYNLKKFDVIIKVLSPGHLYSLLKEMKKHNLIVIALLNRLPLPHNGVRGQKIPRK